MINDTENAMDDKKTNIKFTDDAIELGDVDTFIAREWSENTVKKSLNSLKPRRVERMILFPK